MWLEVTKNVFTVALRELAEVFECSFTGSKNVTSGKIEILLCS